MSQASAEMSAPRRSRLVWAAGAGVYGVIIVVLALAGLVLYGVAGPVEVAVRADNVVIGLLMVAAVFGGWAYVAWLLN